MECYSSSAFCVASFGLGIVSFLYFTLTVMPKQLYLSIKHKTEPETKILILFSLTLIPMTIHYFFTTSRFNEILFMQEYFNLITCAYICYYYLNQMYKLFEKHSILTYFGISCIILTVLYITVLGVYFAVATAIIGPKIFYCSNPLWLMVAIGNFVLSLLFLSIGLVVHRSLKQMNILYKDEALKQMKKLWVLIFVFVLCAVIELIEFGVVLENGAEDCVVDVGEFGTVVVFVGFRVLADYPLLSVVIWQIWRREGRAKKMVIKTFEDSEMNLKFSSFKLNSDVLYSSSNNHSI